MLCCVVLSCVEMCCAVLCCVEMRCAVLCCTVLCCVVLKCVVLCCVEMCCAWLYYIFSIHVSVVSGYDETKEHTSRAATRAEEHQWRFNQGDSALGCEVG